MNIKEALTMAEPKLAKKVIGFNGSSNIFEAILQNFGDYSTTASCIALLNPEISILDGLPFAKFSSSKEAFPIDCFHIDILHNSNAEGQNPEVFKVIGIALAESWNRILQNSKLPGDFSYSEKYGYDIEYQD
jgi:hypothetical protein